MHMQNSSQLPNSISTPKSSAFMPIIPIPQIAQPPSLPTQTEHHSSKLKDTYQTYLELLRKNKLLEVQLTQIEKEKKELQHKFNNVQIEKSNEENKKKRFRRTANEIKRDFLCPVQNCGKSYGADAALIQHIKLKHSQFYGCAEYQAMIQSLSSRKNKENENNHN